MVALPSRREVIAAARGRGQRVAAVLPIHYPRALLAAHRFHAVELWGPPGQDPTAGARHLQAYACGIVRNATAFIVAGRSDALDAILVPHTCDALQGMASVLKDFVRPKPAVLALYLPRGRRDCDVDYLVAELRTLGQRLAALSGHAPSDDELFAAIHAEEQADAACAQLLRARGEVALTDREFYTVLRSREYLDAAAFVAATAAAPRGPSPARGVPLMISGIVPEPMSLFDELAAVGARVVADDLACVSRRLYPTVDEPDPWRRLAQRLLGAPPEPTLGVSIADRVAAVRARLQDSGARGLLVYDPKFCEPELFYLPLLRAALEPAGLPLLHVEFDLSETLPAQVLTRIEAFVERLR